MSNTDLLIGSLSNDLLRVANMIARGSGLGAIRFFIEAQKWNTELKNHKVKPYIKKIITDINNESSENILDMAKAEKFLMYSILLQNYSLHSGINDSSILVREKGSAPIFILVLILITGFLAARIYFYTVESKLESTVKPNTELKVNTEVIPIIRDLSVIPSDKPNPTHLPSPAPNCGVDTANKNTTITANSYGAAFSLSPTSGAYKKGESLVVQLTLDPRGHTIGAIDAVLQFDPARLTISSIVGEVGSYNDFTFPSDTFNNSTGRVYLNLNDKSYAGIFNNSVTFAVINFRVNSSAASGSTEMKFDFDPGNSFKTTDANIIAQGNIIDVLGSVTNGSYFIKPESCN